MKLEHMKKWHKFDPYDIFSSSDIVDITKIEPSEDITQFISKKSGKIIDLGYYGSLGGKDSFWGVYLINSDSDWGNPDRFDKFNNLFEAISRVKALLLSVN